MNNRYDTSFLNSQLLNAAYNGNIDRATKLIERGIDVNIQYKGGPTPLMFAVAGGHVDMVNMLIEKKAYVHFVSAYTSLSPLDIAAEKGYIKIAKILIDKGAKVNDIHGAHSTLTLALVRNQVETAKMLIENGARLSSFNDVYINDHDILKKAVIQKSDQNHSSEHIKVRNKIIHKELSRVTEEIYKNFSKINLEDFKNLINVEIDKALIPKENIKDNKLFDEKCSKLYNNLSESFELRKENRKGFVQSFVGAMTDFFESIGIIDSKEKKLLEGELTKLVTDLNSNKSQLLPAKAQEYKSVGIDQLQFSEPTEPTKAQTHIQDPGEKLQETLLEFDIDLDKFNNDLSNKSDISRENLIDDEKKLLEDLKKIKTELESNFDHKFAEAVINIDMAIEDLSTETPHGSLTQDLQAVVESLKKSNIEIDPKYTSLSNIGTNRAERLREI